MKLHSCQVLFELQEEQDWAPRRGRWLQKPHSGHRAVLLNALQDVQGDHVVAVGRAAGGYVCYANTFLVDLPAAMTAPSAFWFTTFSPASGPLHMLLSLPVSAFLRLTQFLQVFTQKSPQ